jgi:hypothetical protein
MTPLTRHLRLPCSFARNAAKVVVRAVEDGAPHQVDHPGFSLSQAHLEEGVRPVWEAERPPSGVLTLQWGPGPQCQVLTTAIHSEQL